MPLFIFHDLFIAVDISLLEFFIVDYYLSKKKMNFGSKLIILIQLLTISVSAAPFGEDNRLHKRSGYFINL